MFSFSMKAFTASLICLQLERLCVFMWVQCFPCDANLSQNESDMSHELHLATID